MHRRRVTGCVIGTPRRNSETPPSATHPSFVLQVRIVLPRSAGNGPTRMLDSWENADARLCAREWLFPARYRMVLCACTAPTQLRRRGLRVRVLLCILTATATTVLARWVVWGQGAVASQRSNVIPISASRSPNRARQNAWSHALAPRALRHTTPTAGLLQLSC